MIAISEHLRKEIIEHAGGVGNLEACGILAGKLGEAQKVYKMKNTSDSPQKCYFMDPREQLGVMKAIRKEGLEMIGIYHSHPSSEAYPSPKDIELAFYDEAAYVIVSLHPHGKIEFRAFRINEGKVSEEEVET
ncbi:MAG: M67 family metallopeptidase [Candidatus Saganbacteria bacterium]|nr:M67 family metallopeptidase [Candidatus Saganbacteria bacterium]